MLFSGKLVVNLSFKQKLLPDLRVIAALFRFGLPTGFQGIAVNTAGVLLLRFIGSLPQSAAAQAAYTVGYTELFSLITWTSVGLLGATAAVAGQNLGAGKPERTKKAVHAAAKIGLTLATGIGIFYFMWPEFFYGIFGLARNPEVLKFGVQLLRYLSISGLFITIALTYTGGLQGTGDTRSPMYISIISQIIIPIGLCYFFQGTRGLTASIIWLAIVIGHFFRFVLSVLVFNRGKWAKIKVEIAQ